MKITGKPEDIAKTMRALAKIGEIFEFDTEVGVVVWQNLRGNGEWKRGWSVSVNGKIIIWRIKRK